MNKKNGFTLVELMVVIVIIGVLAAVAIPKMMAATNKAKASEGSQLLSSIDNLQTAFRGEYNAYAACDTTGTVSGGTADDGSGWKEIGMDIIPFSRYFNIDVTGSAAANTSIKLPGDVTALETMLIRGVLTNKLGNANIGESIAVNGYGARGASSEELRKLVSNFAGNKALDVTFDGYTTSNR
jgi:prepilin-type N-terminal cleavage/methylation domain-containing protein